MTTMRFVIGLLLAVSSSLLNADVILLKPVGDQPPGRIEGDLLNPTEAPRQKYQIRTSDGARLTLTPDQVAKVILKSEAEQWYQRWLPKMPSTARGNWIMSEECRKRGLRMQREMHLEKILTYESEHINARRALGFRKIDGRWQQPKEYWESRGYVRYQGKWRLVQDVDFEKRLEEREIEEKAWRKKLKMWRTWIVKARGKQVSGRDNIAQIVDKRAAPALAEFLDQDQEFEPLKLLYIDVLARLQRGPGVSAFISRALRDPSDFVRERCLEELSRFGTDRAVTSFIHVLAANDNRLVNRAALALAQLGDPAATRPLIEALVTQHKRTLKPNESNANATFGNGGRAFQFGKNKPLVIRWEEQNQDVLGALTSLNPEVNFEFNEEQWRIWYARRKVPASFELRRDD